jgi:hypothetical protein
MSIATALRTHVPVKYTKDLSAAAGSKMHVRTSHAVFLHCSNLLKRKAECVDHKDYFIGIQFCRFVKLDANDEKDEENQETGILF